jgi:uncharacterized protein (TIGR02265 family)
MAERVIYQNTVVDMLRMLGSPVSPAHLKRLQAIGIDPANVKSAFNHAQYLQLLDLLGELKFPLESPEQRDFEVGKAFVEGAWQTVFGKAILSVMRMLGPLRSARRMTQTLRSVNSFTTAEHTEISDHEVELWVSPVQRPHYYFGVFVESGRRMHGENYVVKFVSCENETAIYRMTW